MKNKDLSNMSPYEAFGIECEDGWKGLYQPIINYIDQYNNNHEDSHIYIDQIKEKFGELRFYWSAENISKEVEDKLHEMVSVAEEESYKVCEICGSREDVGITVGGWYRTICRKCLHELLNNPHYYKDEDKWKSREDGKIYIINKWGQTHEYVK